MVPPGGPLGRGREIDSPGPGPQVGPGTKSKISKKSLGELLTFDIYVYIFRYTNGKTARKGKGVNMIKFNKQGDIGILYTALSNYLSVIENDIPVLKAAGPAFEKMAAHFEQTKKRVEEMINEVC